ncbi:MAG: hypothetical protein ABH986_06155 [archaeon]
MNTKVIALIVAVVLVGVLWIVFGQGQEKKEITFSDGVKEINSLWEKNKVDSSFLVSSSAAISFSSSDLEALKNDLTAFQNSLNDFKQSDETETLKDFTEIHLILVDEMELALQLKEANDRLSAKEITGANLCSNKTDLQFVGTNTILLNEKMHSVNELIYAFNEVHPGLEEEANLASFIADETFFSQAKLENETVLSELERLC